jgi:phosphoglucomutase
MIELEQALDTLILSTSGWRTVFAFDGDEESRDGHLSFAHRLIVSCAAQVFADYLLKTAERPVLVIGRDTRPTGALIADLIIRTLCAGRCTVRYAGVVAAPEIMAYTKISGADGFLYISASHNPIGHNGLKFGQGEGGVLAGGEAALLIEQFRSRIGAAHIPNTDEQLIQEVYEQETAIKKEALGTYRRFTEAIVSDGNEAVLETIKSSIRTQAIGIAADLNGSARTLSIDRVFFTDLGIQYRAINDKPGGIVHRIVPEGESLEPARFFLDQCHQENPAFVLGYTPDCDGDRGNLVIWDEALKTARILEAQEVFALACVAELAQLVWSGKLQYDSHGKPQQKAAIVVNDPTSLRIDRIASYFGAAVFRVEVGEANVVERARTLREEGWIVRILGEGSAGGTITHPSAVRDPLDTVAALVKLLTIRSTALKEGLFELWCRRSGYQYREDFSLSDITASLPVFITTGSYTQEALLHIATTDHVLLKRRYQEIFLQEWERRKEELETKYGITGWTALAYTGQTEHLGISDFGVAGSGGLKVVFIDKNGCQAASMWMRGSKTEPVFRIMVDIEGKRQEMEQDFIVWQRDMIHGADHQEECKIHHNR